MCTFTCTCMQNLISLWNCVIPKPSLQGKNKFISVMKNIYTVVCHTFGMYRALRWTVVFIYLFLITSGNNPIAVNNTQCKGLYSFVNFKASAVCFTNPLITGRYVGISTVRKQALQLCEVEIYLRGTFHQL